MKLVIILCFLFISLSYQQLPPILPNAKCCLNSLGLDCQSDTHTQAAFKFCPTGTTCCFTQNNTQAFVCCNSNQVCSSNYHLANPCISYDNTKNEVINFGVFGNSLTFILGFTKGYWAEQNLTVNVDRVNGSVQQFQYLKSGQYNMVSTAIDNTINYRFNNDAPYNLIGKFDPIAIAATDKGENLTLFSRSMFPTFESLNGKKLGVDFQNSAYAYIAYKLFRSHGMERGVNYTVIEIGGTFQRLGAILSSSIDCTILSADFVFKGLAAGLIPLEQVDQIADPYASSSLTATETWLKANSNVAVRFLTAYYKAQKYALDPANHAECVSILTTLEGPFAEQVYEQSVNSKVGLIGDLNVVTAGIQNVINLRQEFGGFEKNYGVALGCMTTLGGKVYTETYLQQSYTAMHLTYTPPTQVLNALEQYACTLFSLIAITDETGAAVVLHIPFVGLLFTLLALLFIQFK